MHGVFFILPTPCHLPPSLLPSLGSFPLIFSVQLGEAGPESKVQVCLLADESMRGDSPPTVCKYVVTLIKCSSTSQLSFLCVFVFADAWSHLEQQQKRGTDKQTEMSHMWRRTRGRGAQKFFSSSLSSTSLTLSRTHTHTDSLTHTHTHDTL